MADQPITLGIDFKPVANAGSSVERWIRDFENSPKSKIKLNFTIAGSGGFAGINKDVSQFSSYLDRANQRVIAFTSSVGVLYGTVKIFKDMTVNMLEVNNALVKINSTAKLSSGSLADLSTKLFNTARGTSSSFKEAADTFQAFVRQGQSVDKAMQSTTQALTLAKVAGIDAADAVKDLTEATATFAKSGLTMKQIVDGISAVSSRFAISADDLTDAFTRFGQTAQKAGLDFKQIIGLVTAAKVTTQRDGAAIGTALTNAFQKIETKGLVEGLGRINIAIRDTRGNALPLIEVLRNLANAYDTMDENNRRQIDGLIGGARQIEIIRGALSGLTDATGAYARSQDVLARSTGEADKRLTVLNESYSALLERAKAVRTQIDANVGNLIAGPVLKFALGPVGAENPIIKSLEEANGKASTLGGKIAQSVIQGFGSALIFGLGPVLIKAFTNVIGTAFGKLTDAVKSQAGLNTEAERQAQIQKQIVQLYQQGDRALLTQLATMTDIAAQARAVAGALRAQSAGLPSLPSPSKLAPLVSNINRGAAGGFMPIGAEASAIAAGVGGAPSSARPVVIPNFSYGAGQKGPIVANSSEYIVPNFAGGGSAIYNRDMIRTMGLPPGATPVAAGGYIPNMAKGGNPVYSSDSYDYAQESVEFEQTIQRALANARIDAFKAAEKELEFDKIPPFNTVFSQARSQQEELKRQQMEHGFSMIERESGSSPINAGQLRNEIKAGLAEMASKPVSIADKNVFASDIGKAVAEGLARAGSGGKATAEAYAALQQRGLAQGTSEDFLLKKSYQDLLESQGIGQSLQSKTGSTRRDWRTYLNTTNAGIGFSLGATFLGGAISGAAGPAGSGNRAVGAGALGGFLTGAGSGAAIGSFVGPEGTVIGGAVGGIIGGITGALSKITKSYEQLADEIAKKNEDLGKDYDRAAEIFKLQSDLSGAIKSGDQASKQRIERQQDELLGKIEAPDIRNYVKGNIGNPNGVQGLAGTVQDIRDSTSPSQQLQQALSQAFDASSGLPKFGSKGSLIDIFSHRTANVDQSNVESLAKNFAPALTALSDQEKSALRNSLNTAKTPEQVQAAIYQIASKNGVSKDQFYSTDFEQHSKAAHFQQNNFIETQKQAALAALDQAPSGFGTNREEAATQATKLADNLLELSEGFRKASDVIQVVLEGIDKVNKTKQQIILAVGPGTELSKLQLAASNEQQNINSQSAAERIQTALGGRQQLTDLLRKNSFNSPSLNAQIAGATTIEQFQRLGNTTPLQGAAGNEFQTAIASIVGKLNKIDTAQSVSTETSKIVNQLQQIEVGFKESSKQRDELFSVVTEGRNRVSTAGQRAILSTSSLSELSKIQLAGDQEQENIGTTFYNRRLQAGFTTNDQFAAAKAIQAVAATSNLTNLAGPQADLVKGVLNGTVKGGANATQQLSGINQTFASLAAAEQAARIAASAETQLQLVEAQSKQQGELRNRARFSPETFTQIQQQYELGTNTAGGGRDRGNRIENLLNEQGLLGSLGLPQTDQSLQYTGGLQKERVNLTLSQILAKRLGTNVGSSDKDILGAANKLGSSGSDQALKSQITAGVDANNYDAAANIDRIKSGSSSDFSKLLSGSSADQKLNFGFTAIKDAIAGPVGTNALLGTLINLFGGNAPISTGGGTATVAPAATTPYLDSMLGFGIESGTGPLKEQKNGVGLGNLGSTYANSVKPGYSVTADQTPSTPKDNSSLAGAFGSGFKNALTDVKSAVDQFNDLGKETADSLKSRLEGSWDAFVTGAQKGRVAFRDFLIGITSDASKAFGNNAIQTLLSGATNSIAGLFAQPNQSAQGGSIGFASGGLVPSLLSDKEYYVAPNAVQKYGKNFWSGINAGTAPKYATGGMTSGLIRGGSGIRDDIPANLPNGAFIVKQSSVSKYGKNFLDSLVAGKTRGFADGGFLGMDLGFGGYTIPFALIGGLIGGLLDKKNRLQGALIGAGLGATAGAVTNLSVGQSLLGGEGSGAANAPITDQTQTTYNPATSTSGGIGSSGGNSGLDSALTKAGVGLAASLTIGEGARLLSPDPKLLDTQGVINNAAKIQADQASNINNRPAGTFANVVSNGRGGFQLIDFNNTANETNYSGPGRMMGGGIGGASMDIATTSRAMGGAIGGIGGASMEIARAGWASGGDIGGGTVDVAAPSYSPNGSSAPSHQSNISIVIHAAPDGSATSNTTTSTSSLTDPNVARNLGKAIDARIQQFWVDQQRGGGSAQFAQRYSPNSYSQ